MTSTVLVSQTSTFLSEVFPLTIAQPNWCCFRLTPDINKEDGNRLSFHLSRNLTGMVVVWHEHDRYFYALGMPNISMPTQKGWQDILENIQETLTDFGDRYYSIELVQSQLTPAILSQMAFQVLRKTKIRPSDPVASDNKVDVRRELEFWAETIEIQGKLQPALALTIHSSILYRGNLEDFYQNHPNKQNPEELLKELKVRDIDSNSYSTITRLVGTVGQHRERLIKRATREISKQALRVAPDDQPLVTVQFKNRESRDYPIALLRPVVTPETSNSFDVDYGKLHRATKISHKDRTVLLASYRQKAETALATYGFQLERSINSRNHEALFWQSPKKLDETPLLFGKGFIGKRGEVLKGLSERTGGVYCRHANYRDRSSVIRISALKICDFTVNSFLDSVQQRLSSYGFNSEIVTKKPVVISNLKGADARAELERAINETIEVPTDIVLTFLPQSDRKTDDEEGGSLYHRIYSKLMRRGIASQVIYADTLSSVDYRQILNQVIPGMLAKLGNLPFVLAEPLEIADYFVGLDISRKAKQRLPGTRNACASVRLYGKQGEFIRYQLEDDSTLEGEEISQKFLETLLRESELKGKTVLIYRDGAFRGKEAENLRAWAKAIGAQFILVECRKSYNPRLYNLNQKIVSAPEKGLALRFSFREAILVTTKVSERVGLARPLRLTVREEGHQVSIEDVLETTLKLTLLHHGALQTPRLPMPLYGADSIAYLRLKGINFSGILEGDRQFWL